MRWREGRSQPFSHREGGLQGRGILWVKGKEAPPTPTPVSQPWEQGTFTFLLTKSTVW